MLYNRQIPYWQEIIGPMMKLCPKLILTGSSVLYILKITRQVPNDIDFGIIEPLTSSEVLHLKDFFNLKFRSDLSHYGAAHKNITDAINDESSIMIQLWHESDDGMSLLKIDIFKEIIHPKDIIDIKYFSNETTPICHPSIALGYKAKYSFDPRIHESYKHKEDLEKLDKDKYYQVVKRLKSRVEVMYEKTLVDLPF